MTWADVPTLAARFGADSITLEVRFDWSRSAEDFALRVESETMETPWFGVAHLTMDTAETILRDALSEE